MGTDSRTPAMAATALAGILCLPFLGLPAVLTGDNAAQAAAKKASKTQAAKGEAVTINDDVDDPAVWGKLFPLHYELYLKTADMQRTKYGGSEAMPHTPSQADPRSVVATSKVEEDIGLRTMWQGYAFAVNFREERGHAHMLADQTYTLRQQVVAQPGACMNCHASNYAAFKNAGGRRPLSRASRRSTRCLMPKPSSWSSTPSPASTATTPRPWPCGSPVPPSSRASAPTRLRRASRTTT
jgi:Cytochrome c552